MGTSVEHFHDTNRHLEAGTKDKIIVTVLFSTIAFIASLQLIVTGTI